MSTLNTYEIEEGCIAIYIDGTRALVSPVRRNLLDAVAALLVLVDEDQAVAGDVADEQLVGDVRDKAEFLGRTAYNHYAHAVGYTSVRGEALPIWKGLSSDVRAGWMKAAAAIVAEVG